MEPVDDDLMTQVMGNMVKRFGELMKFDCSKHGEYEAHEKIGTCPKCEDDREIEKSRTEAAERRAASLAARWKKCGMTKKFCGITLDDWVVETADQKETKQAAVDFIAGNPKRMLLIGNCGTGKTMLAAGIIGEMSLSADCNPVYTTATRLIRSIRNTWGTNVNEQEAMDKFIDADILVVDELGAGRCSEDDKLMLSEVLCDRYSADMPTLLISNLNGDDIKEKVLDERAADRMREGGKIVVMNGDSKRGELE